ncbi:hypothetical protein NEMIN01_2224 [Nematocida minor]|uniref:uncharacterized protein n=1 Tax=Nematocida minor TaxID=1912983 RepID=UPI00221EBBC2|nr:uncharacterized protein NEMIN01_2224 [Nematocida minor]KAI5192801.1 hypothetical protein NEMIN01_2224 [Nematocida minor]
MEIFKYEPNWSAIERRLKMRIKSEGVDSTSQKILTANTRFYYREESKNEKPEEHLCTICKKESHLPSQCPEKKVEQKAKEEPALYQPSFVFTPTSVKLSNIPLETEKHQIREILRNNNIHTDHVLMVYDKIKREEFKGIIYMELPTLELAEKCVDLFDGMKMGVQIVSATTVENRNRL